MCDILVSKCDSPFNGYAKGILSQKCDTMTYLTLNIFCGRPGLWQICSDWGGI
jgi:hypothetical protein